MEARARGAPRRPVAVAWKERGVTLQAPPGSGFPHLSGGLSSDRAEAGLARIFAAGSPRGRPPARATGAFTRCLQPGGRLAARAAVKIEMFGYHTTCPAGDGKRSRLAGDRHIRKAGGARVAGARAPGDRSGGMYALDAFRTFAVHRASPRRMAGRGFVDAQAPDDVESVRAAGARVDRTHRR